MDLNLTKKYILGSMLCKDILDQHIVVLQKLELLSRKENNERIKKQKELLIAKEKTLNNLINKVVDQYLLLKDNIDFLKGPITTNKLFELTRENNQILQDLDFELNVLTRRYKI